MALETCVVFDGRIVVSNTQRHDHGTGQVTCAMADETSKACAWTVGAVTCSESDRLQGKEIGSFDSGALADPLGLLMRLGISAEFVQVTHDVEDVVENNAAHVALPYPREELQRHGWSSHHRHGRSGHHRQCWRSARLDCPPQAWSPKVRSLSVTHVLTEMQLRSENAIAMPEPVLDGTCRIGTFFDDATRDFDRRKRVELMELVNTPFVELKFENQLFD